MQEPFECVGIFTVEALPRAPGTYLLTLELQGPACLHVGRLGDRVLPAGRYAYVGSAHGPGGPQARVARHLNPARREHWHIDRLTAIAPVTGIWAIISVQPRECEWVRWLLAQAGSSVPVHGFGCSDCRARCPAHLVRIAADLDPAHWRTMSGELA
jgi:Uri superfamily endonuclease